MEPVNVEIGKNKYIIVPFAGRKNFNMLLRITKTLGPTAAQALGSVDFSKGIESASQSEIDVAKIANSLFENMDVANYEKLVSDLLSTTYVNDRPVMDEFDNVFAGPAIWSLPMVITHVLKASYGNFSVPDISGFGKAGSQKTDS